MENREQQILSEIKNMMGTIRAQLELLDAKMAELQQCVDPEEFDNNPIELDIEVPDDDLPFRNGRIRYKSCSSCGSHLEEPAWNRRLRLLGHDG